MSIEPASLGFGTALLLGLSFGAGPCNITCLPYLGPVFMATGRGVADSWPILLPFSLGRILGYSLLGAAAGGAGSLAGQWLDSPWVHWILGGATIGVALSLLVRRRHHSPGGGCTTREGASAGRLPHPAPPLPPTLFAMGMGMAFNPCAPLSMVMVAAAATASIPAGISLGAGFGMGAVAIPTLVFALGVAHLGSQVHLHLRQWRGTLEMASILLLLFMGMATAMGWLAS